MTRNEEVSRRFGDYSINYYYKSQIFAPSLQSPSSRWFHLFSSFIITFRLSINHRPIEMNVILRLTAGQSLRPISSGRLGLKEIRDVKDYRRMDSCFKYYVNANPFLPNAITLWESLVCEVGSGRFSSNNRVTPSRRDGIWCSSD